MSLQVWLPLTKDLRQQGLSNIGVTGSPASWENGKLGKCATWNGSVANVLYNNTTDFNYTDNFSVAFWINPVFTSGSTQYAWTVGRADAGGYGYGFQIANATDGYFRFGNGTYAVNMPSNQWNHYVMTVGNNKVTTYKNGVQTSQSNLPGTLPTYSDGNGMGLGCFHYSANIYPFYGSMNDFRIYDHCLSPMEVKELAKGLVLHYPLNRQGWGQENNIVISNVANRGCSDFTYNSSTQEWTMTCPTGSSTWGYGIVINNTNIKWAINETWIISMDVYVPRTISWYNDINNKPDLEDVSSYTGNDYDVTSQRQACTNGVLGNRALKIGWNHIWFSQTAPTTYGLYNYSTNWGVVTTNETEAITIKIKNIKGEVIGSGLTLQPTPWCPNSSDALATTMGLNGTTEYDCSGFCNNGTRTGTFNWTSDTPKYSVSTTLPNGTDYIKTDWTQSMSEFSIATWVKPNSSNGGYSILTANYGTPSSGFWISTNCESSKVWFYTGRYVKVSGTLSNNEWVHICFTFKNGTPNWYINGVQQTLTTNNLTETSISISNLTIGNSYTGTSWNTKRYGNISDFRLYATALSADDVKSLYQNCATIDPDGTIRGQIRS